MSGITPILDTLLHQVLGRREGVVERALPEQPVAPPRPGREASRLHSDSRLDPRPLPTRGTGLAVDRKGGNGPVADTRAGMARTPARAIAPPLRFSTAARTIADVLARFPAPPSAVKAGKPLLGVSEHVRAPLLAARLRAGIEGSGLFYESHLRRWRSGMFPLRQLLREPQMRGVRSDGVPSARGAARQGSAAGPPAAAMPGRAPTTVAGEVAASPATVSYGADGKPVNALPGAKVPGGPSAVPAGETPAVAADGAVVRPGLESVVRHQLEMLAMPVLRWEGEPWSGVLMALMLQPPPARANEGDADARRGRAQEEDATWHSRLRLDLHHLGELTVDLRLGAQRVALAVAAPPHAVEALEADGDELRGQLAALGFRDVSVAVRARTEDDRHDG